MPWLVTRHERMAPWCTAACRWVWLVWSNHKMDVFPTKAAAETYAAENPAGPNEDRPWRLTPRAIHMKNLGRD